MSRISEKLKKIVHQVTGLSLYKKLPFGVDPLDDLRYHFKEHSFKTFFDVGANIGQSVNHIRSFFPKAEIWCFEPINKTYELLKTNTARQNVKCHKIGLGDEIREIDIYIAEDSSSVSNTLNQPKDSRSSSETTLEVIKIETLDNFCLTHSVDHIDYLKIDTEGYDLNVLKGAINFVENQRISFIETEVSMNPENTYHISFEVIKNYLEEFGYRLFGVYEQVGEKSGKRILRRANILFVAEKNHAIPQ